MASCFLIFRSQPVLLWSEWDSLQEGNTSWWVCWALQRAPSSSFLCSFNKVAGTCQVFEHLFAKARIEGRGFCTRSQLSKHLQIGPSHILMGKHCSEDCCGPATREVFNQQVFRGILPTGWRRMTVTCYLGPILSCFPRFMQYSVEQNGLHDSYTPTRGT